MHILRNLFWHTKSRWNESREPDKSEHFAQETIWEHSCPSATWATICRQKWQFFILDSREPKYFKLWIRQKFLKCAILLKKCVKSESQKRFWWKSILVEIDFPYFASFFPYQNFAFLSVFLSVFFSQGVYSIFSISIQLKRHLTVECLRYQISLKYPRIFVLVAVNFRDQISLVGGDLQFLSEILNGPPRSPEIVGVKSVEIWKRIHPNIEKFVTSTCFYLMKVFVCSNKCMRYVMTHWTFISELNFVPYKLIVAV